MSLKDWERIREIEDELRLAAGLTALREQAGLSQRELAKRVGVSQPRIAAIERSRNVTIELLEQYVEALGARLEISVVLGRHRTHLVGSSPQPVSARSRMAPDPQAAEDHAAKEPGPAVIEEVHTKAKTPAKSRVKAA
jgi:transcriptional regulator with XRE-family HTH domain